MKTVWVGSWLVAVSVLLAACSSGVSIDQDYNQATDFSQLKTYHWYDVSQGQKNTHGNDILDERIRQAVDRELQAKGFQQVTSGDVDFSVNYSITTQAKTDIRSYNTYGGMAPGFTFGYGTGHYRYGYSMMYSTAPEVQTIHYEEGTFVLDIINGGDKLVWRGTAVGRLKKNLSVEEKRQAINNVVGKVLDGFPPES